jgi:hypothetical protein
MKIHRQLLRLVVFHCIDYEQHLPLVATNTVHLGNSSSQETTEGTGKRSSGEEEGSTETEFLTLVPATGFHHVKTRIRK